ncbi:MAG: anti-sigma factor antagonist [Spirochaetes bacterium]|nr:anti-sigma factor antagonist [Spirochaetota bacterium]
MEITESISQIDLEPLTEADDAEAENAILEVRQDLLDAHAVGALEWAVDRLRGSGRCVFIDLNGVVSAERAALSQLTGLCRKARGAGVELYFLGVYARMAERFESASLGDRVLS